MGMMLTPHAAGIDYIYTLDSPFQSSYASGPHHGYKGIFGPTLIMSALWRSPQFRISGRAPGRSAVVKTIRSSVQTEETARVTSKGLPLDLPLNLEVQSGGKTYILRFS